MEKIKYILRGAVILLIVAVMVFSSVAIANTSTKPMLSSKFDNDFHKGYTEINPNGVVLWDNGMHYYNYFASQWDATIPFEAIGADDFQFGETTEVSDVHWIGGYWNPVGDGDFDWNITFYMDRGDDMAPGAKIFEQVFPNADVHETYIENLWSAYFFSYWVDLPDPIIFTGGEKYWISIQGVGIFPPQSHWACHVPIVNHESVFKSPYFGYLDWTNFSEVLDFPFDCCFQLTGDGESVVPDLECEGELRWENVPPGTIVNSTFTVSNVGDVGSMLQWNVSSKPDWGTNWSINWTFLGEMIPDGGYVGTTVPEEVFVEIKVPEKTKKYVGEIVLINSDNPEDTCSISVTCIVPRNRVIYNPLLLRFLDLFPNVFPLLRQLFGL